MNGNAPCLKLHKRIRSFVLHQSLKCLNDLKDVPLVAGREWYGTSLQKGLLPFLKDNVY